MDSSQPKNMPCSFSFNDIIALMSFLQITTY